MDKNIILGERLRRLRLSNKFKTSDVVALLENYGKEITIKTLYKWERGDISPDIDTLSILCHIYNTSIQEIFLHPNSKFVSVGSYEERFLEMIRANKNYKKALMLIIKQNNNIGENKYE